MNPTMAFFGFYKLCYLLIDLKQVNITTFGTTFYAIFSTLHELSSSMGASGALGYFEVEI